MRCPSCGTENAPDSRFCGVCGAAQPPPSRLAPTAKISDDAPIAAPTRPVQQVTPAPGVSYAPPSMPPPGAAGLAPPQQAGLTTKPGGHSAPPRVSGETPQVRPSGPYGQVQPRPSQSFDSVTPTAQNRKPTPIPGTVQRPASGDRRNTDPAFASQHRPQASNASMSFSEAPPSRSLGLIAIVLFIDLGLAGAGAFLLAKGLAKPETKIETKKDEKKSEAPVPTAAPAPTPDTAAPVAPTVTPIEPAPGTAATAPAPEPAAARKSGTTAPKSTATKAGTKTSPSGPTTSPTTSPTTAPTPSPGPTTSPSGPVTSPSGVVPVTAVPTTTPAQPPSTQAEINALATRSSGGFARCKGDAALAGTIDVAFQVMPDGTIANAAAVENTTGNAEVSSCLARVISGWRVSPFQGNAMSFVRSFSYP